MEPYYDKDGITIYNDRCERVLPFIEPVDLVLTDPPYGHGDKWNGGTWASNPIYEEAMKWDSIVAPDWLIQQIVTLAPHSIVWGGNYYDLPPSRCWLSWEKTSRMPTMADFELAWTNLDRPSKAFQSDRNPDGKRFHPTQKPLALIQWALSQAPEDIGTVLDPFMGSGTTLVAAKLAGKRAIGIEQNKKYCDDAIKRLAQGVLPLAM